MRRENGCVGRFATPNGQAVTDLLRHTHLSLASKKVGDDTAYSMISPTKVVSIRGGLFTLLFACACVRAPGTEARSFSGSAADSLESVRVTGGMGRRLDSLLTTYEADGFAGTVLIVQHRRIVLSKGYGFANKEARIRNSPATRFELNSQTKMFTAVAILQLASEGKLRIDDPIERHLGAFPEGKRDATIEHLASHTAGLVVQGADIYGGNSRDVFVDAVKRTPQESPPGSKYRYTNAGYSMLAAIIETKSGLSFEQCLRERIFKPAGLRYTRFRNEVVETDTLFAHGYGPPGSEVHPYEWGTIGAGGVWSTMGDVYRWEDAVENGTVVPAEFRELLHSPPRPPSREAFGWHVYPATDSTRLRIDKGGDSDVFGTQLVMFPKEELVIIWANNDLNKRWRQTLNRELAVLILGSAR